MTCEPSTYFCKADNAPARFIEVSKTQLLDLTTCDPIGNFIVGNITCTDPVVSGASTTLQTVAFSTADRTAIGNSVTVFWTIGGLVIFMLAMMLGIKILKMQP